MQIVSQQHLQDLFRITAKQFTDLVRYDWIRRAIPSAFQAYRDDAVWVLPAPNEELAIRRHLDGRRAALARGQSYTPRFCTLLNDLCVRGEVDPRVNPLSPDWEDELPPMSREVLAKASHNHINFVYLKYAKAMSKQDGTIPLSAVFTGSKTMSEWAHTHPEYATGEITGRGEFVGAKIFPAPVDPEKPLSGVNVKWVALEDAPECARTKRGRKKGVRLNPKQLAGFRAKTARTKRARAAEFRARWECDPALREKFPVESLPPSLRPDWYDGRQAAKGGAVRVTDADVRAVLDEMALEEKSPEAQKD